VPRSGQTAVLVADFAVAAGFDRHMHADHQLAWAAHGVLTIGRDAGGWVLPSSRALWIPAGVPHEVRANRSGGSRCGPAT
jgi:quercetin dioxygenase-like cupin family protein